MVKPGTVAGAVAAVSEEPLLPQNHQPPPPCYGVPVEAYPEPPAQPYVLVPLHPRQGRRRITPACCAAALLLALLVVTLLLGAAAYIAWPSDPDVRLARLELRSIRVYTNRHGGVALDVHMNIRVRVHNRGRFSLACDRVTVQLAYRGHRLGSASAGGAHLRARGVSYVDVKLRLDRVWVLEDTFSLVEDIARGTIPLGTVTRVKGQLHLLAVDVPMEGRISCAINVDVDNQAIASQDCYPES